MATESFPLQTLQLHPFRADFTGRDKQRVEQEDVSRRGRLLRGSTIASAAAKRKNRLR